MVALTIGSHFSPLAGIKLAVTQSSTALEIILDYFSPLAGIKLAETSDLAALARRIIGFQSPCGD